VWLLLLLLVWLGGYVEEDRKRVLMVEVSLVEMVEKKRVTRRMEVGGAEREWLQWELAMKVERTALERLSVHLK